MKVLFVTNASAEIGGGHVMRCLTLADELARVGAAVRFAVNGDATRYVPSLQRAGYPIDVIAKFSDAGMLAERQGGADSVIFDSYDVDRVIERPLRRWAKKIVTIDDLANRRHDCDLLVDTTFGRSAADYRDLVPSSTKVLAGACYALLRPEFAALREESLARRAKGGGVERILVSLGLTDIGGITARVITALLDQPLQVKFDVVLGPNARSRRAVEEMSARDSRVFLHIDPPDMAQLMANADLAIGAGGTTSWERCCLGLPTVLLVLADNQHLVARKLEEAGALLISPLPHACGSAKLSEQVHAMINDPIIRCAMSTAAATIVDGRGAERIARIVHESLEHAA